ncbi:MAG TPA: tetratricopeptide repeat protein, partial [Polyangiales bacterium]|nr:tetratricopeptide repeat protein [Polyangiales bacterium]
MRLKSILVLLTLGCVLSGGHALAEAGAKNKKSSGRAGAAAGKRSKGKAAAAAASSDDDSSSMSSEPPKPLVAEAPSGPVPEGVCVPEEAPKRVAACPSNTPKNMKSGGGMSSKLNEAKRKVEQPKGLQVKGPSIELDVATLRNKEKSEKKAKDLLVRELQVTKRLIKNTRANDPRRPEFLLRLAEGYFELVQVAQGDVRKMDEPLHEACAVKRDKKMCGLVQNKQKEAEKSLADVREENIRTLALLVKDHPDFKKMDEVLFTLGFSLEEMKQYDRARQVYHRLIKGFPQSTYIPNAYLSFAEYYFQQGDMKAAQQFYQKVTEIPAERNKVYGYAIYKQAWCFYNLEDFKKSL